jgi:sugar lactone lactonase YvrE
MSVRVASYRWSFPLLLLAAALVAVACGGGDDGARLVEKLFSPQGNQLDVYDLATGEVITLIPAEQNTVNGHTCLLPDGSGRFLLGEDTRQDEGERQGWGIFVANGGFVAKIPEPETEGEAEQIEPFGCAFHEEGNLFVTDVGSGSFGAEDGKLVTFFGPDYDTFCVLDTTLRTAGAVAIADGDVYVAESVPPGRVQRYAAPFPASADECDTVQVERSVFIEDPDLSTPIGLARAPNGNWYVSSVVIPPKINEYDDDGELVRTIAEGDDIGNPSGIAVAADGTIYYADLGLEERPPPVFYAPGDGTGTVRRITFDEDGNPLPPEVLADGLDYPDAVAVLEVEE